MVINEPDIREKLLAYKKGAAATQNNTAKKRLHDIEKRINELYGLIQSVYEDKVADEYEELEKITDAENQDERDVDEYIRHMKSYAGAEELTREMALHLIEYIKVDAHPASIKHRERLRSFTS